VGSLAEFVVPALVEATGAAGGTFSGCGREDADARMLGSGRPFVVHLEAPRRRSFDAAAARARADAAAAGAAEFLLLFPISTEDGARIPSTHPPKRYRARVEVEGGASAEDAARAATALSGALLAQRTPERVSRRRADRVRERRVLGLVARALPDGALEVEVRAEGGTYVKEMISGDGGRTVPSLASVLGRACRCAELDVLEVEMEDPPAFPAP
jgi:tRNA pseudouridine synthase 10